MSLHRIGTLLVPFLLVACASNPRETIIGLNENDPKYNTDACLQARNIALEYNDKVVSRAGTGLALGILLGPLGIPLAAAVDSNQNDERKLINTEIIRRCVTSDT